MKRQLWFWRVPFSVTWSRVIRANSCFPFLLKWITFEPRRWRQYVPP
jgi:hypothetical protein